MHSKYDARDISKSSETFTTTADISSIISKQATATATATLPKADTVIGFGADYNIKTYQQFIGSLRSTGFTGNIIIGMGSWDGYIHKHKYHTSTSIKVDALARKEILSYLQTQNVSVQMIPIAKCDKKENRDGNAEEYGICLKELQDWKLAWGAYALAREWLRECTACHSGQVLLVPVHSTFFLQSPFQLKRRDNSAIGLHLYETPFPTQNWRVGKFLQQCKEFQWDVPLLSSAIVQGDGMSVLFYLETMVGEIHEWRTRMLASESESESASESESDACHSNSKLHGDEMAMHNYLFYNGALRATIHGPNSGHVSLVPMGASYDNAVGDETSIVVSLDGPNGAFRSWVETKYRMETVVGEVSMPYSSPLQSMAMEYFIRGDRVVLSEWTHKNQQ
jgi:hypothetical protein